MSTQTTKSDGKPFLKKLGVIWMKTAGSGMQYYSGVLNLREIGEDRDIPIVIFKNSNPRDGRNDPDLNIFLQEPKGVASSPAAKPTPKKVAPKSTPAPAPVESPVEENDVL